MNAPVDLARLISDVIAEVQPTADRRGVLVRTTDLAALPARVLTDVDALQRTLHQGLDFTLQALTSGTVDVTLSPRDVDADAWTMSIRATSASGALLATCAAMVHIGRAPDATSPASLRVLVVDDSSLQRALMRTYLEGSPHHVTDVEGGDQAVQQLRAGEFQVVFVDMQMPGMDGRATITAIRDIESSLGRQPAVIVALTALGASDDATEAIDAGADECLSKPLSQQAFLQALTLQPVSDPPAVAPPSTAAPALPPPAPVADDTEDLSLAAVPRGQLMDVARHQLGQILQAPEATRLERLRIVGGTLAEAAQAQGFADVATLARSLSEAAHTATLRDAVIAARTLQAWISHVEQSDQG